MIHMKYQALLGFYKKQDKNLKCRLLQFVG